MDDIYFYYNAFADLLMIRLPKIKIIGRESGLADQYRLQEPQAIKLKPFIISSDKKNVRSSYPSDKIQDRSDGYEDEARQQSQISQSFNLNESIAQQDDLNKEDCKEDGNDEDIHADIHSEINQDSTIEWNECDLQNEVSSQYDIYMKEYEELKLYSLSVQQLRAINMRFIRNIQFIRSGLAEFVKKARVVAGQRYELSVLRLKKKKCLNFQYERQISEKTHAMENKSAMLEGKIRQINLKSSRKQSTKNIALHERPLLQDLIKIREEMIAKKKQEILHCKKIQELDHKIENYKEMVGHLDFALSVDKEEELRKRVIFLQYDIDRKKTDFNMKEISINLENNSIMNEISKIQIAILNTRQRLNEANANKSAIASKRGNSQQNAIAYDRLKIKTENPQHIPEEQHLQKSIEKTRRIYNGSVRIKNNRKHDFEAQLISYSGLESMKKARMQKFEYNSSMNRNTRFDQLKNGRIFNTEPSNFEDN